MDNSLFTVVVVNSCTCILLAHPESAWGSVCFRPNHGRWGCSCAWTAVGCVFSHADMLLQLTDAYIHSLAAIRRMNCTLLLLLLSACVPPARSGPFSFPSSPSDVGTGVEMKFSWRSRGFQFVSNRALGADCYMFQTWSARRATTPANVATTVAGSLILMRECVDLMHTSARTPTRCDMRAHTPPPPKYLLPPLNYLSETTILQVCLQVDSP